MNDVTQTNNISTINLRGTNEAGNLVFLPYDAKAPIVEVGRRTAKIMYKIAKTGANAGVVKGINSCLLVAPLDDADVNDNWEELKPFVRSFLESKQDEVIKAIHLREVKEVSLDSINMNAIISHLKASQVSARVNKEMIASWFDSSISDILAVRLAEKLGVSETPTEADADKIDMFLNVYKSRLSGLASNLTSYLPEEAEKLLKAVEVVEVKDAISMKLVERLDKMINPASSEELLSLL